MNDDAGQKNDFQRLKITNEKPFEMLAIILFWIPAFAEMTIRVTNSRKG